MQRLMSPLNHVIEAVSRAAGQGVFAGLVATSLSHWVWGLNLPILAFVFGVGISSLRSWPRC
jgi:hypothetical protein